MAGLHGPHPPARVLKARAGLHLWLLTVAPKGGTVPSLRPAWPGPEPVTDEVSEINE